MAIRFLNQPGYIPYTGQSLGAYWGNLNPDTPTLELWTTNHQAHASLFELGPQSAQDITRDEFGSIVRNDLHGGSWADYDNDGDLDLIQQVSSDFGDKVTRFYENNGQRLIDRAAENGIAEPLGGQTPLWLDYNRDGKLDLLVSGRSRFGTGPSLFRQTSQNNFVKANSEDGFITPFSYYYQTSDLTGDGIPEVLVDGTRQIYDTSSGKFVDITSNVLGSVKIPDRRDSITGDFNNDLKPDLWVTRSQLSSQTNQIRPNELRSFWDTRQAGRLVGTRLRSDQPVTITIPFFDPSKIFIGSTRANPSSNTFTLSPNDQRLANPGSAPADGDGVYINYQASRKNWTVEAIGRKRLQIYGFIQASEAINNWKTIGYTNNQIEVPNQLFLNEGGKLVDRTASAGLNAAIAATSGRGVVAGDFDNDGDLDVYVLATGIAGNLPNKLFENNGDGTFTTINSAWGATGTGLGLGDAVTTADINNDGFLDIMTTNGAFFLGKGNVSRAYYNDAPYEVFLNQRNANNWLRVDLRGTVSNRDGLGSSVIVRAKLNPSENNIVTAQLRERNGGMHLYAQDDSRLHFGLKQAQKVESLEVKWLSGLRQKHYNLNVNEQINLVEGRGTWRVDFLIGNNKDDTLIGSGGNDILRGNNGDDILFGGANNDRLIGGFGSDILVGGSNRDKFIYQSFLEGNDTIRGFQVGIDRIQIQRQKFDASFRRGNLSNSQFVLGTGPTLNQAQFIYSDTGVLSYDPDGVGAQKAHILATLENAPMISRRDILVV